MVNARYIYLSIVLMTAMRSWAGGFELSEFDVEQKTWEEKIKEKEKSAKERATELQQKSLETEFVQTQPKKTTIPQKVKSLLGFGGEEKTSSSELQQLLTTEETKPTKTLKEKATEAVSAIKNLFTSSSPKTIIVESVTTDIEKQLADKNVKSLEDVDKSAANSFFAAVSNFAFTLQDGEKLAKIQPAVSDSIDVLTSENALAQLTIPQRTALDGWLIQLNSNYERAQRNVRILDITDLHDKVAKARANVKKFDEDIQRALRVLDVMDGKGVSVDSRETLNKILNRHSKIKSFEEEIQNLPSVQDVIAALDEVAKSKVTLGVNEAASLKQAVKLIQLKYQNIEKNGTSDQKKTYDADIKNLDKKIKQLDDAISRKTKSK